MKSLQILKISFLLDYWKVLDLSRNILVQKMSRKVVKRLCLDKEKQFFGPGRAEIGLREEKFQDVVQMD